MTRWPWLSQAASTPLAQLEDRAGDLVADHARRLRRVGVEAHARHHVGEVDARGGDVDPHLARARARGPGAPAPASTSGPPCLVITTARIRSGHPMPIAARAQRGSTDQPSTKPSEATISSTHLVAGRRASVVTTIAARRGLLPVAAAVGAVADGGRGDVDAVGAEDRADAADHAGQVLVAEHGHVALELDRQPPALDLDQVGHAAGADAGAGDRHALARPRATVTRISSLKSSASETDLLLDDDPPLLGHRGGVDEVDLLLGAALERAHDHRERRAGACRSRRSVRGRRPRCARPSCPRRAPSPGARAGWRAAGTAPAPPCPRRRSRGC